MKIKSSKLPTRDSDNYIVTGRSEGRRILVWGFLSTLFFVILFALKPTLLQPLDFINYDLLLKNFPNNHASSRLVIVDLDEKSLNRYGQWPWPRYRVAELLDKIAAMKPAIISLDIFFPEPDRTSAATLLKDIGRNYHVNLAIDRLPVKLSDNDRILAETLSRGPFVLGNVFQFDNSKKSSEQCVLHPVKVAYMQNKGDGKRTRGFRKALVFCAIYQYSQQGSARQVFLISVPIWTAC